MMRRNYTLYLLINWVTHVYSTLSFISSDLSFLVTDPSLYISAFINTTRTPFSLWTDWASSDVKFSQSNLNLVACHDNNSVRLVNDVNVPWGTLFHTKHNVELANPPLVDSIFMNQLQQNLQSNETKILHLISFWGQELKDKNTDHTDDAQNLHQLILSRVMDYLDELRLSFQDFTHKIKECYTHSNKDTLPVAMPFLLPHPNKILHFISPKIPAIRQSPDIMLRIVSADIQDMHVAAFALLAIGTSVSLHECYYRHAKLWVNSTDFIHIHVHWDEGHKKSHHAVAQDILIDRRFEQLLECILSRFDQTTISDIFQMVHGLHSLRFHKSTHVLCDMDPRHLINMLANKTHDLLLQHLDTLFEVPNGELPNTIQKDRFDTNVRTLSKHVVSSIQCFGNVWDSIEIQRLKNTCVDILYRKVRDLWMMQPRESSCSEVEEEIIDKLAMADVSPKENAVEPKEDSLDLDREDVRVCDLVSSADKESILCILESWTKSCEEDDTVHILLEHLRLPPY